MTRGGWASIAVGWVPVPEVAGRVLHPGFAAAWPRLSAALERVTVIVDTANVMGSRADGWWRDRAGAATRLHGEVAALAACGVPGEGRPRLAERAVAVDKGGRSRLMGGGRS